MRVYYVHFIAEVYSGSLGHVSMDGLEQKSTMTQSGPSNQTAAIQHLDLKLETG